MTSFSCFSSESMLFLTIETDYLTSPTTNALLGGFYPASRGFSLAQLLAFRKLFAPLLSRFFCFIFIRPFSPGAYKTNQLRD